LQAEIIYNNDILISPNPVTDYLEIAINNVILSEAKNPVLNVKVFNVLGVEVMAASIHPMTQSHRMNIENLPPGVYFVQIGSRMQRFVKM